MDKILQFTCLKLHFQGVEVFAPVLQAGGHYTLQSANRILCGVRGNEFNFTSIITAKSWINDNLAKLAKAGKTSEAYLLDLIIAQNATTQVWLAEEIATIEARNAGDWSVWFADELTENFELGFYVLDNEALQGMVDTAVQGLSAGVDEMQVNQISQGIMQNHEATHSHLDNVGVQSIADNVVNDAMAEHLAEPNFQVKKHWLLADIANIAAGQVDNHIQATHHFTQAELEQEIADAIAAQPSVGGVTYGTPLFNVTWALVSKFTANHGLGRNPDGFITYLECINANAGWAVGSRIYDFNQKAVWSNGVSFGINTGGLFPTLMNNTNGSTFTMVAANWRLYCKPYIFN